MNTRKKIPSTELRSKINWSNFLATILIQGFKIFTAAFFTTLVVAIPLLIIVAMLDSLPYDPMTKVGEMYGTRFNNWFIDNFFGISGLFTLFIFTFFYEFLTLKGGDIFEDSKIFNKHGDVKWVDIIEVQTEKYAPKYEQTDKGLIDVETGQIADSSSMETDYNLYPWEKRFSYHWFKMWLSYILIIFVIIFVLYKFATINVY